MKIEEYEKKMFPLINKCIPYESIFIDAFVSDGRLSIKNDYFEHGPDGFRSTHIKRFDEENTQKLFTQLIKLNPDPIEALRNLVGVNEGERPLEDLCRREGIQYTDGHVYS